MKYLITGGTGSLGNYIVPHLLKEKNKIAIYSRDEFKQSVMKQKFSDLNYYVGDVRDYNRLREVIIDFKPEIIIHAAAMKRIEICEENPFETVKTDVIGGKNIVDLANEFNIKAIAVSTDKAVKPVNVYGMSKAIQERIFTNAGFNCVRYGNVIGSRGSVIPLFKKLSDSKKTLTITNPKMTRFLITLNDAIELIFEAIKDKREGYIFVKKAPSSTVQEIADYFSKDQKVIGERKGEKLHEVLVSEEEMQRAIETDKYYIIGKEIISEKRFEYTSENTRRLTKEELKKLLDEWKKEALEI
ncbi:MAG: polysaccharide biosynthesis protein [Candidatus Woesearchaeota archaeon]